MLEMQETLKTCFNVSAPGPDHITWQHLKLILANHFCAIGILPLANVCLSLWHWPRHFKEFVSVIIPKPGKPAYNTPKAFRPIVADTSLSLTTTMVNSKILNKSIKSPTLPPGL